VLMTIVFSFRMLKVKDQNQLCYQLHFDLDIKSNIYLDINCEYK